MISLIIKALKLQSLPVHLIKNYKFTIQQFIISSQNLIMKQFFKTKSFKGNSVVLLGYNSFQSNYTFLESDFNNLHRIEGLQNLTQTPFINQFRKYKSNLEQVQGFNFKTFNLGDLHYNDSPFSDVRPNKIGWVQNQQIVRLLSKSYKQMTEQILLKIQPINLNHYLQIITTFNCINVRLWQKIYAIVSSKYKNQPLWTRKIWSTVCQQYVTKFQYKQNKMNSQFKFVYPEHCLNDIASFRDFIKKTQFQEDYVNKGDNHQDTQNKLQILRSRIKLIQKTAKIVDINVYFLKEKLKNRTEQIIAIVKNHRASLLHQNVLMSLYRFYAYINYQDLQFLTKIQQYAYQYFTKIFKQKNENQQKFSQEVSKQTLKKITSSILGIWKLNQMPNMQIFKQFLKPILIQMLQKGQNVDFYEQIAASLLASGVGQMDLIKNFLDKGIQNSIKREFSSGHLLKHYMNIHQNNNVYQTGNYCAHNQNSFLQKYIASNFKEQNIYSQCLKATGGQFRRKKTLLQIQEVQIFWFKVLDQLFVGQTTFKNQHFCVYQIDYMVFIFNKLIVIEIVGGHYTKKRFNEDNNYQQIKTTGKKKIREQILKYYGVNIIKIHCQDPENNLIMQVRNIQLAKHKILQKIHSIIPNWRPRQQNNSKDLSQKKYKKHHEKSE